MAWPEEDMVVLLIRLLLVVVLVVLLTAGGQLQGGKHGDKTDCVPDEDVP